MTDRQEFREREALKKEVQALEQQEQELERLRAILAPDYWPRIYAMLDHIRKEMKDVEKSLRTDRKDVA